MSKTDDSLRRPAKGPRIGLAQIAPSLGDAAANLERHRAAVDKAIADNCDLLVFPELSLAGYRLKDSVPDLAIKRGSDTWKELETLSKEVALVVGFVEETADHLFYNAAAYFEAGKCVSVHRKTYLPTYGMFDEQRYFARGRGIAAFDTKCGRVAMLVCEDFLHPTAVTVAACDGATLLIVPSASPARGVTGEGEADSNARSWESYVQVMARSFGVWVAYCNRVGVEDGVSFWGGSEVVSPAGERVVKAAYYDEDYVHAVLSDDAVRRRRIVNPLVRDEDLDLTINELSRIRGRAVVKAAAEQKSAVPASQERTAPRVSRDSGDGDKPPRRFDREDAPPKRFDRDAPPQGRFDRDDGPPKRFDRDSPPRPFNRDAPPPRRPPEGFRPSGSYEQRGGGFKPRRDDSSGDKPRFDGPPRPRFGAPPRSGFGGPPRDRDDAPRGRGGFGGPPRGRDDGPRGGGGGGFGGPPRGRDDAPRGRFGGGGGGGFGGPPRGATGGPPRGPMGAAPRGRDDRGGAGGGGGSFGGKPRFNDGPRDRQRPEPARKPFHKGAKPRGRKDD